MELTVRYDMGGDQNTNYASHYYQGLEWDIVVLSLDANYTAICFFSDFNGR